MFIKVLKVAVHVHSNTSLSLLCQSGSYKPNEDVITISICLQKYRPHENGTMHTILNSES